MTSPDPISGIINKKRRNYWTNEFRSESIEARDGSGLRSLRILRLLPSRRTGFNAVKKRCFLETGKFLLNHSRVRIRLSQGVNFGMTFRVFIQSLHGLLPELWYLIGNLSLVFSMIEGIKIKLSKTSHQKAFKIHFYINILQYRFSNHLRQKTIILNYSDLIQHQEP